MGKIDLIRSLDVERTFKFSLRKKDEPLIDFDIVLTGMRETLCRIHKVRNGDPQLLPYGLKVQDSELLSWLHSRFIPKNRVFVENLLSALPDLDPPLVNLLNTTLGLSLVDDYWILPESRTDLSWANHNLYENEFSETLALVAFTGYQEKVRGIVSSPEFTTNGMLPKCWRRIDGGIYLYKGGTEGAANAGLEPYSEYYASQVAEAMNIHHVGYELEKWKGRLCSTCSLFTSQDRSYVPAHIAYPGLSASELLFAIANVQDFYDRLIDIMILDIVIANHDRHFGNFGFIRNNHTGVLDDVAPAFDNGMSLLHQAMESDLLEVDPYLDWRKYTFAFVPNKELGFLAKYMEPDHRSKLRKLVDFEFEKHPSYNLDDKRLRFLSEFVRSRARSLLNTG
ncbi:XRE family transcriptional regulator [Paenibacillus koleovorans]|uniref:XRE family transcriptional regulator n=1 Tax=Paenibacillus koleovorans TaxID=121608 RepID=UPI000FD6BA5C|nr:XRE family transcriptional regulator [Paenibacillus koleovorans]